MYWSTLLTFNKSLCGQTKIPYTEFHIPKIYKWQTTSMLYLLSFFDSLFHEMWKSFHKTERKGYISYIDG